MSDGFDFQIDLPDLPGFVAAFRAAPQMMQSELRVAAKVISSRGEQISKVNAPVGRTGNLRGSVYGRPEGGGTNVSAVWGATADYAMVVEKGRGAGKPMPPQGVLLGWGGVTPENEYVIRRSIGRKGIKARPFVGKAFDQIKGGFAQKEFSAAIQRVLAKIGGGG